MEINVRVEVQFNAPETTTLRDMLHMFRTPMWVRFMVRYIAPHLRNCAPTNHDALEKLTKRRCPGSERALCVVCMAETAEGVALPCGHVFHADCIEAWLKMRSTCPTCRFQLPKAFSGCYAVKTLNSALVLRPEHEQMEREAMMKTALGPGPVRAVVNVTLYHVADADRQQQFPCVLNALLLHSNGQVSADAAGSTAAEQPKPAEPVTSPTASSPTAFSASGSTSGSTSASASASAASLPSPATSTSTTDRRRRRRADQEDETQEDATFACATKSPQASPPHHKRMRMTS